MTNETTTTTITVPAFIDVYIKATNETVTFDVHEMAGAQDAFRYGIKQQLADGYAPAKQFAEANDISRKQAVEILAAKRFDRMMQGTVGAGGGSTDPMGKAIRQILSARLKGWKDLDSATRKAKVENVRNGIGADGRPNDAALSIQSAARAIVAQREKMAEADLSDI